MAGNAAGISRGGTGQTTAPGARIALGLEIGVDVEAWDAGLDALAAFNTNGIIVQTANDTYAGRTLTAPVAGFTITNPAGTAGNPTFVLANDLNAVEALSTNGIVTRTATDTWTTRTLTGTAAEITVTNGDGVAGVPTLSLPTALTFTGKTITGGIYANPAITTTGTVTISSVDAGPIGPVFDIYHNSASPAVADTPNLFTMSANSSTGVKRILAQFSTSYTDPVNATEDADLFIQTRIAGTLTTQAQLTATGWNSMNIGATTRGTGAFTTLALTTDLPVTEGGTGVSTITGLVSGNGTSAFVGRTITGTTGEITVTNGDGVSGNPTISLPTGHLVDSVTTTYATNADITGAAAVIPLDDTVPLSTEGVQILSVAISPKTTTNKLRCRFVGQVSQSAGGNQMGAMFQGTTCIDATYTSTGAAGSAASMKMEAEFTPGSTSSVTISVRIGVQAAANVIRLNGATTGRFFGGASIATLVVEEIKA